MTEPVVIASDLVQATVSPDVGGTITEIVHRPSGLSVLGRVPWDTIAEPIAGFAARDEPEWLTRYTGGWPLLFPNAGDACMFDGVFHGFHGEASISPWDCKATGNAIRLTRSFHTVPVEMTRIISIAGDRIVVEEAITMQGPRSIDVMWGHHPTFGSDLLAGPIEMTTSSGMVSIDEGYDPPANPLTPGGSGALNSLPGRRGAVDLAHPAAPLAALGYFHDLRDDPWVAIRRLDNAIAASLSWDARKFPCAWLWFELQGTKDPPWNGRCSLIGIEPNTTQCAYGLAQSAARAANLLRLAPDSRHETKLELRVFSPEGPIRRKP